MAEKRARARGNRGSASAGATLVRNAAKKDLPAIMRLWKEMALFHSRRDASFETARGATASYGKHLAGIVGSEDWHITVAEREGRVIGYCTSRIESLPPVFTRKKVGHIIDMCVTARCRRRGMGHMLFDDACRWLKGRGVDRVEVTFADMNEISRKFWPSLGFRPFTQRRYLDI